MHQEPLEDAVTAQHADVVSPEERGSRVSQDRAPGTQTDEDGARLVPRCERPADHSASFPVEHFLASDFQPPRLACRAWDSSHLGAPPWGTDGVELAALQEIMAATYGERDAARGREMAVAWLAEELGELAQAVRKGSPEQQLHELGDVLAWLASLANQLGLSLEEAAGRYAGGCPTCARLPCACPMTS